MTISFWSPNVFADLIYKICVVMENLYLTEGMTGTLLDLSEEKNHRQTLLLFEKEKRRAAQTLLFINCGNRKSIGICTILQQSDIVVIVIPEYKQTALETFYNQMPIRANKILYFLDYIPDQTIQTQHIEYGIIPYNPFFLKAYERGQLARYMKKNSSTAEFATNEWFLKELKNTMTLLKGAMRNAREKETNYERSI
ncbi:MAG: hypothetical protein RSD55_04480 [Lachnospiraceae bacterium]